MIKEATGISTSALVRLANDRFNRIDVNVVDRLCDFFKCQIGDLLMHAPDQKPEDKELRE